MDRRAFLNRVTRAGLALAVLPFAGVPFLLKNLGTALAAAPLSSGSRLFAGNRAEATSGTVRRLLEAGRAVCRIGEHLRYLRLPRALRHYGRLSSDSVNSLTCSMIRA